MKYDLERVATITKELFPYIEEQRLPVYVVDYKKGFFIQPKDASADSQPWEKFDTRSRKWLGPSSHAWFKFKFTVPPELSGKYLKIAIRTNRLGWDAINPQFLMFLNGREWQGFDVNHLSAPLTKKAQAGETWEIDLQAYTGEPSKSGGLNQIDPSKNIKSYEMDLSFEIMVVNPIIEKLFYDLQIPVWLAKRLDEGSSRRKIITALIEAVTLLDLRKIPSKEFYTSAKAAIDFMAAKLYDSGEDSVLASCIGHTHIDVAWLWTVEQTKEKSARSFSTALRLMDVYPDYKFMSSQPQLYAFVKERYPAMFKEIQQRVAEGRWEIEGAMWLEPDCNLPSGESFVRQLLYGKNFIRENFKHESKILWLPDVFGYSAALPQILKKSGVDYFMTTKLAWNQYNMIPMDTFMWQGIDGSEVLAHFITTPNAGQSKDSYFTTYNGMLYPAEIVGAWDRYLQKEINNDVLVSCGYGDGGGGTTYEMVEVANRLHHTLPGSPKVNFETALEYFKRLEKNVIGNKRLPKWVGELYFELHRGTYTSIARNKRNNRKNEFLLQDLEYFSVLASELGASYPKDDIDKAWLLMLLNQFHDILPGSSIRQVYEQTDVEYAQIKKMCEETIKKNLALLCEHIPSPQDGFAVFNTLSFERDDLVLIPCDTQKVKGLSTIDGLEIPCTATAAGLLTYVKHIPAKGYTLLHPTLHAFTEKNICKYTKSSIETDYYRVTWNEHGQFTSYFDKVNKREILKEAELGNVFKVFEDRPMGNENWDIDVYHKDKFWVIDETTRIEWLTQSDVRSSLLVEQRFLNSKIRQLIHFSAFSARIDFETVVDWQESQLLLKVEFPTNVYSEKATFDIQFGNIERFTHNNTSWQEAQFEVCAHKWCDLSEQGFGLALLNDCKYGHTVKSSTMLITLIKSGNFPHATADQEQHIFTYSTFSHSGTWREGKVNQEAYKLNVPVYTHCVAANTAEKKLTPSVIDLDMPNVICESIKRSEDGKAIILRVFEYQHKRVCCTAKIALAFTHIYECDLMENKLKEIEATDTQIQFTITPYEIKTFRLE